MSLKSISFALISFWLGGMPWSSSEVVVVNRNKIDIFHVGKDGCTNDTNVCPTSAFCRTSDGFCQCKSSVPTYRNFIPKGLTGLVSDCVSDSLIGLSSNNDKNNCPFKISNVIPSSHDGSPVKFSYSDSNEELKTCTFVKAWTKTPNLPIEMKLEWMTDSYVSLNVSLSSLYFKWKKSVPELQGTIIYFSLKCESRSGQFKSCLGGKVLGTWLAGSPLTCSVDTSWYYGFHRKGWKNCSSNNSFITGLYRNTSGSQRIILIEWANCCSSAPAFSAQSSVCKVANWSTSLDSDNTWSYCPQGYFLNGLYRGDGNRLGDIEYGNCCKPKKHLDKYRLCYDEDVAESFNDEGWSDCSKAGYYITGFYRGPGGDGLDNIDKFRCCQMTMEVTAFSIEPTTLTTGATSESERTKSTSSKDKNDDNLNILTKIVIGVLALSLLVIIVLAFVVRCLWKKQQSNQDRYLEETEMPNIDNKRAENPEYKVDGYEVVRSGKENKGASITKNEHASGVYDYVHPGTSNICSIREPHYKNNDRLSDTYDEQDPTKHYTTLRRFGQEDLEENYQSLTKD